MYIKKKKEKNIFYDTFYFMIFFKSKSDDFFLSSPRKSLLRFSSVHRTCFMLPPLSPPDRVLSYILTYDDGSLLGEGYV